VLLKETSKRAEESIIAAIVNPRYLHSLVESFTYSIPDSYPFGSVKSRKTAQHSGCRPLTLSAFIRQSCKVIPFRTFTCDQRGKKI